IRHTRCLSDWSSDVCSSDLFCRVGLTSEADTAKVALTRIDSDLHRVVLQVDLSRAAGTSEAVRNGDALRVARLRPTLDAGVLLRSEERRVGKECRSGRPRCR